MRSSLRKRRFQVTIAAPFLYVIGGILLGWTLPAFNRHKLFGSLLLVGAAACLTIAAMGSTVTIPKITVHPHISTSSTP